MSIAVVFMALTCVATMSFTLYVPSTKGFFNIGETMVYITALLFGPLIGAFAGGVGSAIADILLGYYYYAPATLVIKAVEGGIVGFLGRKKSVFSKLHTKFEWKIFTLEMGVLVGALTSLIGFLYYSGTVEFYYGFPPSENPTSTFFIPIEFWLGLGIFVAVLMAVIAFVSEPEYGWIVISTILGGLLMVLGYFLYEQFILGVLAIAEVPVNIGQMTVGLIIATPIVKIIQRTLPQIKG
ncbi:MAG: ECF transporter S component [Candidatus Bathycorpusculaceae bacterium]